MKWKRTITKVGTSHAVLIPADVSRYLELKKGMNIDISINEENGEITLNIKSRPKNNKG